MNYWGSQRSEADIHQVCTRVSGSPSGKGVSPLVLAWGVDVTNGKVMHDFGHVLVVEECVPTGFVWEAEGESLSSVIACRQSRLLQRTVQSDVMHGQDDGSVAFGDPLHRAMDSSIWSLHIMFL